MTRRPIETAIDGRGVASVTLARPEVHNAFDETTIAELTGALDDLGADPRVRVVQIRARGPSFSAGADLNWMRRMAGYGHDENLADARALARLLATLARHPKPTVAAVQGSAFGGGVGLVAACDIAVGVAAARFSFSEARLGLIPAVISPFVIAAVGERAARRYFLTAERFDAAEAARLGLLHAVVPDEAGLEATVESFTSTLLDHGPQTLAAVKDLVAAVAGRPIDAALLDDVARRIAEQRVTPEGREGIAAFLEKRRPAWPAP